ncbi:hypothetical protein KUCAC02_031027 [Chaenocephalus aceratus]|uniref:Uncharacterized protein n=1 Tax=Chaenocephalus aceratus TaxID=36190 RepID=A0ACB9XLJ9_CHAAC|nr:hypothetical protein KUCAC02_031027 [Chaenocephalus aceratus]
MAHQATPSFPEGPDDGAEVSAGAASGGLPHHSGSHQVPLDYPYSPPTFRFLTKMWHPNIYENGDVCISILHPPVDDPQSGELPSERWNPTQNVRTILLSVISLLNEPNTFSPANVDASVMFRKWRDSKGRTRVCRDNQEDGGTSTRRYDNQDDSGNEDS